MATSVPAPQNNPPDPQITSVGQTTAGNVNIATFASRDPAGFVEYEAYRAQAETALFEKYDAEEKENFGANANAVIPRQDAERDSRLAANQRFASQIVAAGAGTLTTTTTPLLAQQPQPPGGPTTPVTPADNPQVPRDTPPPDPAAPSPGQADQDLANQTFANRENARLQATIQAQRKQANDGDWRVKLRLAAGANYLYKATEPGILEPLSVSDGVVFPYTPKINTSYSATYSATDLTHSNYKGYFYQGSSVGEVKISAAFTAQDTFEANYLLAVIHFFRSVTKMFYGQDQQYRGAPPPLVFLQGLGEYQFNLHPCVVSQFDYVLPDDVDYIRARSVSVNGTNLLQKRDRQTVSNGSDSTSAGRLQGAGLSAGGIFIPPPPPTLGIDKPTYVPTKMEISITLLPIQTRAQLSQEFSLAKFANGNLVRGGYW